MVYLASDAVGPLAEWTLENIHIIFYDCPPCAVWGLAVECVLDVCLGLLH